MPTYEVKILTQAPTVSMRPTLLSQVVFQHHSAHELMVIEPQDYSCIARERKPDMGIPGVVKYLTDREHEEDAYRLALGIIDTSMSFTYATVTGFNDMTSPDDYPGFTYFFELTREQVSNTLFGIVGGIPELNLEPQRGLQALELCMSHWLRHQHEFAVVNDDLVGAIDPRIEVIIPYRVIPTAVLLEVERR
jgi:hypothetical protein